MIEWVRPSVLVKLGILGMNGRNVDYIGRYNDRRLYPLVDNKLKTKKLASEHGLNTPELLGYIEFQREIKKVNELIPEGEGFVIKPAQGSGGKGILVILSHDGRSFEKPSGERLDMAEIKRHISNTLSGLYSLGGKNDVAMFEKLIEFDNVFEGFSYEGVPDVRVIIYRGFPAMAMMRLSTAASDGKANLHQGAVGVGIDIVDGKAVNAVQFDRPIELHPDTGKELHSLIVPHWDEILKIAAGSYDMTGLGYLGVDVVLDKKRGPMLLELNARPGLAIQIANNCGMLKRFELIDEVADRGLNAAERIAFSKRSFSSPG
jgi:alpha-L-glutamate ligase-like protein